MSDHYETRCPSCGGSDEQGCYADCPTTTIAALRAENERLRAALVWIDSQRYTDRSTINQDNAFEKAVKLNSSLLAIMDRARAALEGRA